MEKQREWKKLLKADPTDKLLEKLERLERYYLLREIIERPEDDAEVRSLKIALVDEILGRQMEDGSWNGQPYDYANGTTHQLMKLAELGLSPEDEPVKKGTDYLFLHQAEDGSFIQGKLNCVCGTDIDPVARNFPLIKSNPIITNAALLALTRTGHGDDPRVEKGYEWLCNWQDEDGSWSSPRARLCKERGEGYPNTFCGIHSTCNALLGLSATEKTRTSQAARRGADFLLSWYGYKRLLPVQPPHDDKSTPFNGAWFDPRCATPANQPPPPDIVIEAASTYHVLSTLATLGYSLENEKVRAGVQRLIEWQSPDGLWLVDHPFLDHYQFTLHILLAIKSLYQPLQVFSLHGH
ncbi:MAG: hypothetical protein JSU58_01455 [Dehalococcoidales bacterium]|nr:MAG: hypothetical protein JSU58_01455 [Dehalococcoidales bacterium]